MQPLKLPHSHHGAKATIARWFAAPSERGPVARALDAAKKALAGG